MLGLLLLLFVDWCCFSSFLFMCMQASVHALEMSLVSN